jgi:hypothetical protein
MAGGGSSELREIRGELGLLQQQITALQRQVAGLQSALRGGDVAPASAKPAKVAKVSINAVRKTVVGERGR